MPTGYQLLLLPCRHKREGDDFPNLEAQQENEPISRIECLFGFYRGTFYVCFFLQVSIIWFGPTQKRYCTLQLAYSVFWNPPSFAESVYCSGLKYLNLFDVNGLTKSAILIHIKFPFIFAKLLLIKLRPRGKSFIISELSVISLSVWFLYLFRVHSIRRLV